MIGKYSTVTCCTTTFIIKFPYNRGSDWLKERTLSDKTARVDDVNLAFKFCFGILSNLTQGKLFVSNKYGSLTKNIVNNISVKTLTKNFARTRQNAQRNKQLNSQPSACFNERHYILVRKAEIILKK